MLNITFAGFVLQVRTHAAAIKKFKPDVVVGKSQGGPTMLKLIQNKVSIVTFIHLRFKTMHKYRRSGLDPQFFAAQPSYQAWIIWSCHLTRFPCLFASDAMTNRFDRKQPPHVEIMVFQARPRQVKDCLLQLRSLQVTIRLARQFAQTNVDRLGNTWVKVP